ncbi:hypothetical protein ACZ11_03915 [Lysinibacillus xylanilyticus]|uniref:Uncharacterized protein n=1 Tax=Lysinibacillus xylanilyticus TaxID=582475 RepID=A0A0K9F9W0_9BACI|nr:hypothetical protein ACZ11_03915 [Lysinibacillus xylanilyticus]
MSYKTVAKEFGIDHSMIRRWASGKRLQKCHSRRILLLFAIWLLINNTWKCFGVTNGFKGMLRSEVKPISYSHFFVKDF